MNFRFKLVRLFNPMNLRRKYKILKTLFALNITNLILKLNLINKIKKQYATTH